MKTPGQLMAERSERERLDIHNRLTLQIKDIQEDIKITPLMLVPEPEWTKKQSYIVQQLQAEAMHWRKQHAQILTLIDEITEERLRKKKRYK